MTDHKHLIHIALKVKVHAYVPYSGLRVGAALLCNDGTIFTGVNIENVSFGATNCAERTAIFKAVSEGYREFTAIAIASDMDSIIYPCGICRQVLAEFGIPTIVVGNNEGNHQVYSMKDMLPYAFTDFESDTKQGM